MMNHKADEAEGTYPIAGQKEMEEQIKTGDEIAEPNTVIDQHSRRLLSLAAILEQRKVCLKAIENALLAENEANPSPRLTEEEVRDLASNAGEKFRAVIHVDDTLDRSSAVATSETRRPDLLCLADVKAMPVPWMWKGYLAFGMLAMLSGDPEAGKTFISLAIAADLSNGLIPASGGTCAPISTLYLSLENAPEFVLRPRFDALKGNPERFTILRGSVIGEGKSAHKASVTLKDIALLEAAIEKTHAQLIIIDPIQSYLGADVDSHKSNETRPVMDGLIALAEKYNVCVLVLRHLSKSGGGRAIHRGLGSIDLTGAVRTEMLAGNAAGDPDSRALVQIKNNVAQHADSMGYEIVGQEMEARLEWLGKSELTANDLLAPDSEAEARSDMDEAVDFLQEQLTIGPKSQKELSALSGFPDRTLQRAFKKLGGKRSRDGAGGAWIWHLS